MTTGGWFLMNETETMVIFMAVWAFRRLTRE